MAINSDHSTLSPRIQTLRAIRTRSGRSRSANRCLSPTGTSPASRRVSEMVRGSLVARSSPSAFVIPSASAFFRSRAPSAPRLDNPLEDKASEVHPNNQRKTREPRSTTMATSTPWTAITTTHVNARLKRGRGFVITSLKLSEKLGGIDRFVVLLRSQEIEYCSPLS